jgi:hypothetical protein
LLSNADRLDWLRRAEALVTVMEVAANLLPLLAQPGSSKQAAAIMAATFGEDWCIVITGTDLNAVCVGTSAASAVPACCSSRLDSVGRYSIADLPVALQQGPSELELHPLQQNLNHL